MKARFPILVLAFAVAANAFAFSKYPMMKNHRIECALARGSAEAPAATFPLEISDRPRAFWWDDKAFHAGTETIPWKKLGVKPCNGAEFSCELVSDEGKRVEFFCQLKERAAIFHVPSFGVLGNRTITNDVVITSQIAGSVGLRFNAVGARTPRFIREYTRKLGAGETTHMEILGKAADSGNCFVDLFDSDGGILFMAFYRFHDPAVRFAYRTITSDLGNEKLRLLADQWFEPGEKNTLTMRMKDLKTGADSGWSQSVPMKDVTGVVTTEVDVKELPAGIYRAEYEIRDATGKTFVSDYAYYAKEKDGVCDWTDTDYGLADEVPPPWTVPEFRANGFDCWNRTVSFGGKGLVASIVSSGNEFLSGPVQLLRNEKPLEFEVTLVEAKVAKAKYRLVSKDRSVTVDLAVDFDGFMWFDVHHDARARLSLRIPAKRKRVVGFDDCSSPLEKLALKKGADVRIAYNPELKQWWWFGGTEGLMGGIESLRGWRLKDREQGYVFEANDRDVTLTMNFVDTPSNDGKERTLGFYLMPTPVKEKDAGLALQLAQKRSKLAWATKSHTPFFEFVYPGWQIEEKMQPYFQMQDRGERVFWYTASKGVSPVCPWWGRFGQVWNDDGTPAVFAEEIQPKSREQHERQVWRTGCMNSKSFFEQKLWGYCKFIEHPDYHVTDLYCDLAAQHRCRNEEHGCQWRDDFGKLCCDSDLRRVRDYHQRLYKVLKKKNPQGAMIGHLQYQRTPSDVYFDWLVMGETYDRFIRASMSYYDVLTPEMMQIQYASRASEVIVDMLPQIDRALSMIAPHKLKDYNPKSPENDRVNRHATAYFKIHDLAVTPQPRGADQWSAPDKVLAGFGARRRHYGYYHPRCPISVSAPDPRFLYCIYGGNRKRLVILLNDTDRTVTETVTVKGLSTKGREILRGTEYDFTSGACEIAFGPREALFILFE